MRKVGSTSDSVYSVSRIYLSDFRAIWELLSDNLERLTVKVGEFELDGVAELAEIKKTFVDHWEISGWDEQRDYLSVGSRSPGPGGVAVYVANRQNLKIVGLASKVESILARLGPKHSYRSLTYAFLLTSLGIPFVLIPKSRWPWQPHSTLDLRLALLLYAIVYAASWIRVVLLERRRGRLVMAESPSGFWRRNKDALLVNAIIAIVASGLTILADIVITKLRTKP